MSDTLIPADYTLRYGVAELHALFFQHSADRGGIAHCVSVLIPEAEHRLEIALEQARQLKARVVIVCDTAEQAKAARARSAPLLPDHHEVSLERAAAGAWVPHA
jgi:hypothetical protein